MNESFSVGRALSLGFAAMFRNFIPFVVLGVIVHVPLILYTQYAVSHVLALEGKEALDALLRMGLILIVMGWMLRTLLAASVTYGVVMQAGGHHAPIGASVVKGLGRLLPCMAIGVLVAVIVFAPFVILALASPLLAFLWIPFALVLYCMYYVAVPASVCEKPGLAGALGRSKDLTAGHKGGVFGLLILLGIMDWAAGKVLDQMFDTDLRMRLWAGMGVDLLFGILGACVCAASYYLLRSEKEGTSADDLAAVFG